MNKPRLVAAIVMAFTCALAAGSSQAQTEWLITAGREWGPISLGMSEDDTIRILGSPLSRPSNGPGMHVLTYANATLFFSPGSQTFVLESILITAPGSVTREGIRLGSSLAEVLRAYGDVFDNNRRLENGRFVSCLSVILVGDRRPGREQVDYTVMHLTLEYLDRGIVFDFFSPISRDRPGTPMVSTITVTQPESCRLP